MICNSKNQLIVRVFAFVKGFDRMRKNRRRIASGETANQTVSPRWIPTGDPILYTIFHVSGGMHSVALSETGKDPSCGKFPKWEDRHHRPAPASLPTETSFTGITTQWLRDGYLLFKEIDPLQLEVQTAGRFFRQEFQTLVKASISQLASKKGGNCVRAINLVYF